MRHGFKITIRHGTEEEYVSRHQNVHEDLLQAFKEYGIKTYSIFMDGTTLFGYIEADDVEESMKRIGETTANTVWQQFMSNIIVSEEGKSGVLKEVFYFKGV
jgi:L-rhamnose mutarotase